jgi:hypothetical protein
MNIQIRAFMSKLFSRALFFSRSFRLLGEYGMNTRKLRVKFSLQIGGALFLNFFWFNIPQLATEN